MSQTIVDVLVQIELMNVISRKKQQKKKRLASNRNGVTLVVIAPQTTSEITRNRLMGILVPQYETYENCMNFVMTKIFSNTRLV